MRMVFGKALAVTAALAIATTGLTIAPLTTADAHGPTRRKVQEHVEINAAPAKVWAVIGNFQDMSWLGVVEKTEGDKGNEIGATRKLTLKGGATVDEELYKFDAEKMSYSYRITAVDVKVLDHLGGAQCRRQGQRRGVDRRVLPRLPQQRPAAGTERRGRGECRDRALQRRT
jgi:hypothetical protein